MNATVKFHLSQYLRQGKLKWVIEKFLQVYTSMSQQQASMMLMMHIGFMKLPNLVYKEEISIYENGSQTMKTCSMALMNRKLIIHQEVTITK